MTSCFLFFGTCTLLLRAGWVPLSVVSWLLLGVQTFSWRSRRLAYCQRSMHRKRRSPMRSVYLPRLDFRLLVFTAYQIHHSWAYIFHATDPDLCRFLRAVRLLHESFLGVCNSVSRVQYYFYPGASCEFLKFLLIVGCLFLVAMFIGYKLALIRFRAHFSKSPKPDDRVKISVPTKFCLRGRNRSKRCQSKAIYLSVRQVFVSETNLEDIPSVDNFDHSRLCVVDNCANAHIWNTKEDFEASSLRPISWLSKVATIGGSNFCP